MQTNDLSVLTKGLSGGKLRYAGRGGGNQPVVNQETAETTSSPKSVYGDMFRGRLRGVGAITCPPPCFESPEDPGVCIQIGNDGEGMPCGVKSPEPPCTKDCYGKKIPCTETCYSSPGSVGGPKKCTPPCRNDGKGNCIKDCNGVAIPCDANCTPGKPPEKPVVTIPGGGNTTVPGTGPCNCNMVTTKVEMWFSRTPSPNAIPVKGTSEVMKCEPSKGTATYKWDCASDLAKVNDLLNSLKGIGAMDKDYGSTPFIPAGGQKQGSSAPTGGASTGNKPCPTNCVKAVVESQYYMSETRTADSVGPFILLKTEEICNPVDQAGKVNVSCEEMKKALQAKGYSLSGLADCGCGGCGTSGLADGQTHWGWKVAGAGIAIGTIYLLTRKKTRKKK